MVYALFSMTGWRNTRHDDGASPKNGIPLSTSPPYISLSAFVGGKAE
jgi:hypothetical protein